jgi:hypothetical protein
MTNRHPWLIALTFASAALGACRQRAVAPSAPIAPSAVSFHAAIEPVLDRHCASSEGCHGPHPTHSVSLDLRVGHAYQALVSAPAKIRDGTFRVAPGSPERSFLIDKLLGTLTADEGKTMPLDPDTGAPLQTSPLPPGFVEATLTDWIARGAPRN